ncbi:LysR family transcriptional regulator [Nocardia aurantia]|uniref:Hydrogen peroxide-inducible genes activator n=1 Tax=Nocardia aurantia TaxID=2585199 RepID=A0A7K0DRR1_9NOCA|nr:LysR family transcriptional regulator [Nocardia aurantia]MQY28439.1 Hydrogen peroxide-inducible genes activator [Nocardia aurantia]
MPDPLDLLHLRTLVTIAETGGFRRAAAALHLSQPTVSQHIRLLERRLDCVLIEKGSRTARFTPAGEWLVAESRRLLAAQGEVLARFARSPKLQMTIGSTEHAAAGLLADLLGVLRAAYPEANLHFRIDRSATLADAVLKGALDLVLVLGGNTAEPIGTEVAALALHWFAARGWQVPPPPGPIPLVAFAEPCGLRKLAVRILGERGYEVSVTAESGNLDGLLAAAGAGFGVALLPYLSAVPCELDRIVTLPPAGAVDVRLIARRGLADHIESTAVRAVTAHYRSIAIDDGLSTAQQ